MLPKVHKTIEKMLRKVGVEGDIELVVPPNSDMGDLAFATFGLAKKEQKSPQEVAKRIHDALRKKRTALIERVQFSGPYVNFFLRSEGFSKLVLKDIEKKREKYGSTKAGKRKKIIIEYPSNNTHKEFHIGHLRNICIGNTLVGLYRKSGYTPVPVNYLNDFGAHVVRCLWGLQKFHAAEQAPENKQKWLGDVYAQASAYAKEHAEEVRGELDDLQKKLEAKDKNIWPLFVQTREWSIEGIERMFRELGVSHAMTFYEKDIKGRGQQIVDDLVQNGIAKPGEGGAIIVDLTSYKLDIALLRKSSGAGLYITSDLALAEKKFKKVRGAVESIHITGTEQNFYFQQLFKVLELFGFKEKMTHIGYGLVNTKEGKMSSRAGNIILYESLRDAVKNAIEKETRSRHSDWSEENIQKVVQTLTFATLKFTLQKHEAGKNIVFDITEATSFDGFTAPYILYSVARINSVLKKATTSSSPSYATLRSKEEKKVLMLLAQYDEIIAKALHLYNPSVIAKYCFDLAQAFSEFYNVHRILEAETLDATADRLVLCRSVRMVLVDALALLTIDTAEEM